MIGTETILKLECLLGAFPILENLHDPSNLIDPFLATIASVPIVCLVFFVRWQRSFVPQSREVYGFDASIQKLRSHVTYSQMSVAFSRSAGNSRLVKQFPSWRDCGVTYP